MLNVLAIFVLGMLAGMNTEYSRAMALFNDGRVPEAVEEYELSVVRAWADFKFWREYGTALCYADRPAEGLAAYDRSLAMRDDAETQCRKACMMLLHGQWEAGWRHYETRFRRFPIKGPTRPWWDGEPVKGTLGIYCEGGYGDWFQFTRYIVGAREKASRFVMLDNTAHARADSYTSLLSLPLATGIYDPADSHQPPYLLHDGPLYTKWRERLSNIEGLKIGICWQGNPKGDQERAIPLSAFRSLAEIATLISLQKVHGLDQSQGVDWMTEFADLDQATKPFEDTGRLIANLDLVITCDSAIAHLAGGIGKPVWVALPVLPDWRWGLGGEATPWYPNMRLFRQRHRGGWGDVFRQMAVELSKWR